MKIKSSELTGAALDWAVSLITNPEWTEEDRAMNTYDYVDTGDPDDEPYMPSEDWSLAGPIIEREEIGTRANRPCSTGREWEASPSITAKGAGGRWGYGPTPLIAAMRCFVASKLGDEVEVPDELVPLSRNN